MMSKTRVEAIAVYGPQGHIGSFTVSDTAGNRAAQADQIWQQAPPEQRQQLANATGVRILSECQFDWRTATFREFAEFQRQWQQLHRVLSSSKRPPTL